MNKVQGRLLVFFEEPFWIGVFEKITEGKLSVCKVTFGAEPKGYEILEYIIKNYDKLKFSPSVDSITQERESVNPKRLHREIKKQMITVCISTKSQQALKLVQERGKAERKKFKKESQEIRKDCLYQLKQQKKKEKHKGR